MSKYILKPLIACATFALGVGAAGLVGNIESSLRWKQPQPQIGEQASPQAPPLSTSTDEIESLPEELSPYNIELFIATHPNANLAELWQRLGIHRQNLAGDWQSNPTSAGFLTSCTDCQAEILEHDFDGEPGAEVLLKIEDRLTESCRYVVFRWNEQLDSWKVIGHIDYNFGRYRMPQHKILLSNNRSLLVIQGQGASGSGVSLYFDRVFLVEPNALKEVLSYTSEGTQSVFGSGPTRDFSGQISNCIIQHGMAKIEIEFAVTYSSEDDSRPTHEFALFTKRQKAVFTGRVGKRMLKLNAVNSALSQNELEAVFNIDSLTNEDFLKYNFAELSQVALRGTQIKGSGWRSSCPKLITL